MPRKRDRVLLAVVFIAIAGTILQGLPEALQALSDLFLTH